MKIRTNIQAGRGGMAARYGEMPGRTIRSLPENRCAREPPECPSRCHCSYTTSLQRLPGSQWEPGLVLPGLEWVLRLR